MEESETDKLLGRISAQEALQRELWIMFLQLTERPSEMAEVLRENMISAVENHGKFSADAPADRKYAVSQAAIEHLERFWSAVAERVKLG